MRFFCAEAYERRIAGKYIQGVGYCPVKSFIDDAIYGTNGINKRGPITNVLGKLDWLLFIRIAAKYLESYGFPIIVTYNQECDYSDSAGNHCHEGYVTRETTAPDNSITKIQITCPACESRKIIGPGTQFEVDAPRDSSQHDMMADPVKIIPMDTATMEYYVGRIATMEDEIYLNCVGYDGDSMNNEAINETQVAANFESKENVLMRLKSELEKTMNFAAATIARMRYGAMYLRGEINLGQDFYLTNVNDLITTFKSSEGSGLPIHFIDKLSQQIRYTKFKTNSEQLRRDEILSHLEPYPGLSLAQLQSYGIKDVDTYNFILKLNFVTFIRRFERENMNIIEFGSLLPLQSKIDIIKQKLLSYVAETNKAASPQLDRGSD